MWANSHETLSGFAGQGSHKLSCGSQRVAPEPDIASRHSLPRGTSSMHLKESQSESSRTRHAVSLRFDTAEAAAILRMSRAQLYKRIKSGALRRQKDGTRTYITREELERYVQS